MHKSLYDLQDLIAEEVAEVVEKKILNAETLCNLDKAIDIYKDIYMMDKDEMNGSAYGYPMDYRGYAETGRGYAEGIRGFYESGRGSGNRNSGRGGSTRGYYDNNDTQRMRDHYERELRRATSEQERENIRRMIRELDQTM